jgi:hypothetical protein
MLSLIPQLWHCSMCEWSGAIPTHYVRQHFDMGVRRQELVPRDSIPWPTCPGCGEHRFYIEDLPLPGASRAN